MLLLSACGGGTVVVSPDPDTSATLPAGLRWVRASAEYRALAHQTYAMATEQLPELVVGRPPNTWAVVLDADETVLDNSEYQRRRAVIDSGFTITTWNAWSLEGIAPAVPGAVEFTRAVRQAGGKVIIVTNRDDSTCDATRRNLAALGATVDLVLCQLPGESDKNIRFERVSTGQAAPGIPPLEIVAWVGDNIHDFPGLSQESRDSTAWLQFGRRYFILPNPMYGSWEQ